jgi:uroporphyrinogen-III synthase
MTSAPRILVTRSQPGADETARRLEALGYQPVVEPLFGLEHLPAVLPQQLDALAFTSANGVRAFARIDPRRDLPAFVVGGRTAGAAREAGFTEIVSAEGDVTALVALIRARLAAGSRLLHAANEDAVGDLAGGLRAAGIDTGFVPLYRAAPVSEPGPALRRHLEGHQEFDAVLIHSPRAAAILAGFVAASPMPAQLYVAAISAQAVRPLKDLPHGEAVAERPDEPSLLEALAHLLNPA